jgi:hypothetical protein
VNYFIKNDKKRKNPTPGFLASGHLSHYMLIFLNS